MKGIVFTELISMIDNKFGLHVTEEVILASNLPSGGAYTSVGTYPHSEIVSLVTNLAAISQQSVSALIQTFGEHLLGRFTILFPDFFSGITDATDFLSQVDHYLHAEVRKLYPDAELPSLDISRQDDGALEMLYRSDRMMGDLAEGLIAGTIQHFGNMHTYERTDLDQDGGAQCIQFTVTAKQTSAT